MTCPTRKRLIKSFASSLHSFARIIGVSSKQIWATECFRVQSTSSSSSSTKKAPWCAKHSKYSTLLLLIRYFWLLLQLQLKGRKVSGLKTSVAGSQPQQPPFSASGLSSFVYCNPMQSSAIVGWMPTHESRSSFVSPHFIAMPRP